MTTRTATERTITTMKDDATKEVIQHGIDLLDDLKGQEVEASELHHHLYNEDYFIIGTYQAKQFLEKFGTFDAIELVRQYEQDNFGETYTEVDPEKIANMFAYIKGEEALQECETLSEKWDETLTDTDLDAIKAELQAQL